MHAPPPFQITVRHVGVWRAGCSALVVAALLITVAWAVRASAAHPLWLAFSVTAWACASLAVWRHARRLAPVSLRWDGQVWHFGPAATIGQEPHSGCLRVALDLGSWMLLRFESAGCVDWLPAQRLGHEAAWHGFRATVYCARPASLPNAAPF